MSAKFKQRREAYAIAASISETVSDARAMLEIGMAKEVAGKIGPLLADIERNPVAQKMVAERAPNEMREAKALAKEAAAGMSSQVRTISSGEWHTRDGATETRVSIGQSAKGFHHAVEVSSFGGEAAGGGWSKPHPSQQAAREAGLAAEARAQGGDDRTPRAKHAARLQDAAAHRRTGDVRQAKSAVIAARETRQGHETGQRRSTGRDR